MITLSDAVIDNPAVWTADELRADPSWTIAWTDGEIAEMHALVAASRHGGDVEAPLLKARLDRIAHGLETGRGLYVLRGAPVERWSEAEAEALTLWIGRQLGTPRGQNDKGALVTAVRDVGADYARDAEARGYMSNAELQPHTDGCDVTGLLCLARAKSGGETCIASSLAIYNHILETEPELLEPLIAGLPYYLRDADGRGGRLLDRPVPVYFAEDGTISAFFNGKSVEVGVERRGVPLDPLERRALDRVRALANDLQFCAELMLEPGDLLVFSNWTTFHSRKEFVDQDDPAHRRCLLRLWIHSKYERPLPAWIAASARGGLGGSS
ncbi:MAG: TauD/TfdA family dioxygenase [Pseudomonadota bacterium]